MADMPMDSMPVSSMAMTFFGGAGTSLYSTQFTPTSTGGYAGVCIFLIVLTITYRSLFALKSSLDARWAGQAVRRRYVVVADRPPEAERMRSDEDAKTGVLMANGVEEEVKVVERHSKGARPWRFSVDLPRAALVTVIVGVGYLLMLAVMTLNVGYFASILGGAFVGELIVGRYGTAVEEHH